MILELISLCYRNSIAQFIWLEIYDDYIISDKVSRNEWITYWLNKKLTNLYEGNLQAALNIK